MNRIFLSSSIVWEMIASDMPLFKRVNISRRFGSWETTFLNCSLVTLPSLLGSNLWNKYELILKA